MGSLDRWFDALGGKPMAQVVCIGDSITEGTSASTVTKRWQSLLQARFNPSGPALPFIPAWPASPVAGWPVTRSGAVRDTGSGSTKWGFGWRTAELHDSPATVTFTFTGTSAGLQYTAASNGAIMGVSVDGGAVELVDTKVAFSGGGLHVIDGIASGAHTVTVTRDASSTAGDSVWLQGILVYRGDWQNGVRFLDAGHHGITSYFLTEDADRIPGLAGSPTAGWDGALQAATGADLAIIMLGFNDYWTDITPELFAGNIRALVDGIRHPDAPRPRFEGSILLVGQYLGNGRDPDRWQLWHDQLSAMAAADPDIAYLDLRRTMPPVNDDPDDLYDADLIHPNDKGYQRIADTIGEVLEILPWQVDVGGLRMGAGTRFPLRNMDGFEELPGFRTADAARPWSHGVWAGSDLADGRYVQLAWKVRPQSAAEFEQALGDMSRVMVPGPSIPLRANIPTHPGRGILRWDARVRRYRVPVDFAYRVGIVTDAAAELFAPDPVAYGPTRRTAATWGGILTRQNLFGNPSVEADTAEFTASNLTTIGRSNQDGAAIASGSWYLTAQLGETTNATTFVRQNLSLVPVEGQWVGVQCVSREPTAKSFQRIGIQMFDAGTGSTFSASPWLAGSSTARTHRQAAQIGAGRVTIAGILGVSGSGSGITAPPPRGLVTTDAWFAVVGDAEHEVTDELDAGYFDGDTPGGFGMNDGAGWLSQLTIRYSTMTMSNAGTAPSWPVLEVEGLTATDGGYEIRDDATGRRVRFVGNIPTGRVLSINTAEGTAVLDDGTDLSDGLKLRDWSPVPAGGILNVTGVQYGGSDATLAARWADAWW